LELIEQALRAQEKVWGPAHWQFADAHFNAGWALRIMGRLDEAVEHFERALEILAPTPAASWRLTSSVYDELCNLERSRGRLERAVQYARRAVEHADRLPGTHRVLEGTLVRLATFLGWMGETEEWQHVNARLEAIRARRTG